MKLASESRVMTITEVAALAGITSRTISPYKNSHSEPPLGTLRAILKVLDFPLYFAFGEDLDTLDNHNDLTDHVSRKCIMEVNKKLYSYFHGRIIDSLGIQMYQSPVAALAELIANAWDADATSVQINLPDEITEESEISIIDNGIGMSFEQCQNCYLNVGRNRRVENGDSYSVGGRPILGRKGIGKFAGFGIARVLTVDTMSKETGEHTVFSLDLNALRGDHYIKTEGKEVQVSEAYLPNEAKKQAHGTTITLKGLTISRKPSKSQFAESMARRFLINQNTHHFTVRVNDLPLPDNNKLMGVEFDFPKDYREEEKPSNLTIQEDRAIEMIGDRQISWRIRFTKATIQNEELRGISIFCGIKVAQTPFFFNLTGGLPAQHGQTYMTGQVQADYLDTMDADIITTERQRINWELPETKSLEEWGQNRVKSLLLIWKKRRAEEKIKRIEDKVAPLAQRLNLLQSTERKIVSNALKRVASVETISDEQFIDLSNGFITAWEQGRLKNLINQISDTSDLDENALLNLLMETQVLNALHIAEAVKAKLEIINGLRIRIESKELENSVRDYIAKNPWLLSPEWETFRKEVSIKNLVEEAAKEAGFEDSANNKRIDLVMSSGTQLLLVEFMRPGLKVDRDHIYRYQTYIDIIRTKIESNTQIHFKKVSGLLIADKLDNPVGMDKVLKRLAHDDMKALEWINLLESASSQWQDFFEILVSRAPTDQRILDLQDTLHGTIK